MIYRIKGLGCYRFAQVKRVHPKVLHW